MRILDPAQQAALGAALADAAPPAGLSRRDFLKSGAAAGLIVVIPLAGSAQALAAEAEAAGFAPDAFIRVAPDNTVTIVIKHHEMGQGSTTGLATLAADELDADWARVRAEYAPSNPQLYANTLMGIQGTGGSTAIANSWEQMRKAGATARAMLVQAAAERWQVPAGEIRTSKSRLTHPASGKHASYGDMAEAAAKLTPPAEVTLKDPAQFTLIGRQDTRRLDSVAKCNGQAVYTSDVKLPGLLTAVVARAPVFGARLKSFNADAAKQVPGVTDVVQVPEGVAVVASGMWPALQGRRALQLDWDLGGAETRSSAQLFAEYRELAKQPGLLVHRSPASTQAPAVRSIEASYEFPYLAHATMEPMNCVAWLHDGRLETWSGHQVQTVDHQNAATAAGLPMDKVALHTLISGGSFGRRANAASDFVVEAVHVAKAIGGRAPVRLQRTREDDFLAGYYRPLVLHAVKIDLDAQGRIVAWDQRIVGQSILAGTPFEAVMAKGGIDSTSVEGAAEIPYAVPNRTLGLHSPTVGVPVLWWRSVGSTHTAYVIETLIDEIAVATSQDPVQLRLSLLQDRPRHAGALRLVAEKSGWSRTLPPGLARGVALHESFNSTIAQVVEVRLVDGKPRVERVVVAVDCGTPVNPDVIRAQMEGGVGFALAAALYGAVDLEAGAPRQSNFHDYPVLRIHEMPKVEVHIVPSSAAPTGVGEPGVPPLAPALANALYRLTGQRLRRLPLLRQDAHSA